MQKLKTTTPRYLSHALAILTLAVILAMAGCASYDDRNPRPPKLSLPEFSTDGLLKKVALSLFDNRTQLRFEEVERSFLLPLNNQVKDDCSDLVLLTPFDPGFPAAIVDATLPAAGGTLDNIALAKTGRFHGLNAVVTGRLESISGFEREKGFWLFKENQHYERIMIQVAMYDVETGAKLLSEAYSEEVEISTAEFQALATGTVGNSPAVMEVFADLAETIAEDICEVLENTAWISFVTRVDNQSVTVSSGADAGLKPGSRLELFSSDKTIETKGGSRFFVPGLKTGEIEIVEVTPHTALGRLLPEGTALPGYAVRLR